MSRAALMGRGDPKRVGSLKGWVTLKEGEPKEWETLRMGSLKGGRPEKDGETLKGWETLKRWGP